MVLKGVILAGGRGTRLHPCTAVINKHLLPVGNKPMIYYPLETLRKMGCTDLLMVTGGENPSEFMRLIKDGKQFGFNSVLYAYQDNPTGGIADALSLAESFINVNEKFVMILGDNLILTTESLNSGDEIYESVNEFLTEPIGRAHIFIKEVEDASSFGVIELSSEKTVVNIIEKPKTLKTQSKAVIGLYLYDQTVFDVIRNIKPSDRDELEITDVNMYYVNKKHITYTELKSSTKWLDTGSFESLYKANTLLLGK